MTTDEIDAKLARVGVRVAARGSELDQHLAAIGFLDGARALCETFGATVTGCKDGEYVFGHNLRYGQPYNFDLRGHTNGAVVQDRPSSAPRKAHKKRSHKPGPIPTSLRDRAAGTD